MIPELDKAALPLDMPSTGSIVWDIAQMRSDLI